MLYLPPGVAHDGVAETECLTWSIGFRAPSDRELVAGFLDFLHERLEPRGHYGDAGSAPARHPGEIPPALAAHVGRALAGIRWTAADVREFAGRFLSEPKAHVYFTAPPRPLAFAQLRPARLPPGARARRARAAAVFWHDVLPERRARRASRTARAVLVKRLADDRRLTAPVEAPRPFWQTMHAWYLRRDSWRAKGSNDERLAAIAAQAGLPSAPRRRGLARRDRRGDRGRAAHHPHLRRDARQPRVQLARARREAARVHRGRPRAPPADRAARDRICSSASARGCSRCCASSRCRSRSTARWPRRATPTTRS